MRPDDTLKSAIVINARTAQGRDGMVRGVLAALALVMSAAAAQAQVVTPDVVITPQLPAEQVGGVPFQALLKVTLPAGVYVQSNKPRDPALIPTVLTIDAPDVVTVVKITYPKAKDLKQLNQRKPLKVYGPEFVIGVVLRPANRAAYTDKQPVIVAAHLRYQACNASVCFPPAQADTQWAPLKVVLVEVRRGGDDFPPARAAAPAEGRHEDVEVAAQGALSVSDGARSNAGSHMRRICCRRRPRASTDAHGGTVAWWRTGSRRQRGDPARSVGGDSASTTGQGRTSSQILAALLVLPVVLPIV